MYEVVRLVIVSVRFVAMLGQKARPRAWRDGESRRDKCTAKVRGGRSGNSGIASPTWSRRGLPAIQICHQAHADYDHANHGSVWKALHQPLILWHLPR